MSDEPMTNPTPVSNQHRPVYEQEILGLIAKNLSPKALQEALEDYHDNDIAEASRHLDPQAREKFFNLLDNDRLADVLSYLDEDEQAEFLNTLQIKKSVAILAKMEPQEVGILLKELSPTRRAVIFELLDEKQRRKINSIEAYGLEAIGSEMATDFIEIRRGSNVKEAMRAMRDQARATDTDNLSILYVIDENGLYYGAIRIQDLFAARADTSLEDIIEINFPIVYASERVDDIVDDLKDYDEDSIPVLSHENILEGIITRQHLLEVLDQRFSEDYVKLAGVSAEEDLEETVFQSMAKRTPWLLLLLFLSLAVSSTIAAFEGVVAKLTIAVVFQSLILDMSGNVGTQSLAVSIRVLADPDVTTKQKRALIWKETQTGLANGVIIGGGAAILLGLFIHWFQHYPWNQAYAISLCIGVAMMISMMISSFTGTIIPIGFQRFHIDPAAASGPLITTLNDLCGAVTYYSMIWFFLIYLMHL